MLNKLTETQASRSTILIRLAIGLVVFVPEGIQKLAFPAILGSGRFAKIGIPWPEILGPFVGVVEIACGLLIVLGLLTRLATIPLIITMIVALISTKLPILVGHDVGMFHVPDLPRYGFWSAQHEARTDLAMLFGCLYLLTVGAGRRSLDTRLASRSADE